MHGDLTPWNLRRFPRGMLALIDWEDACWGPPAADAVLFRASAAALGQPLDAAPAELEAIEFWETRVRERSGAQARDARLSRDLLDALARMRIPSARSRTRAPRVLRTAPRS
jgi:aminoglycoside phosphotransferase (APT) family kinase protein